ncbi:hypothetical protein AOX59_01360 [Lentibacillus amyloliquefaciens]|uniref:Uncharacterized protein n=2 Tax=Lentibacillus amyloliquefaciens TaxID=1472767 RepID=A0A0U4FA62_9BACI|nr:hypothetical protein AOX59_01360 [Lentibacillus amyloliquefaciens]
MRFIPIVIVLLLVLSGVYYLFEESEVFTKDSIEPSSQAVEKSDNKLQSKEVPDNRSTVPLEGNTYQWMNKSTNELLEKFGEPLRKDASPYGYEWWLYTNEQNQFIQFGVENDSVVSIYGLGKHLSIEPADIGMTYDSARDVFTMSNEVTYNEESSSYTFKLSDEELVERPLVKITDSIFLQLYFDTVTQELSAFRMLSADTLLKHQPYEMHYRGELPEAPELTDEQWEKVEEGAEQQIFHITNVMRSQHGKSGLEWDENVSDVAYLHSEDMAQNSYFSHYAENGDGLKERLEAKNIFYQSAGENIAAQYPDAQAALHGWLNSKGHREALLKEDFTHLGAGVHRFHYTQNFLKKE